MPISFQECVRRSFFAALPMLVALTLPLQAADAPPTPQGHDHVAMPGHTHAAMTPGDGRELVAFPPEMRVHQLRNMRDHLATLDGILRDLASANYEDAAVLADEHLGLDSPSAAGCKPKPADAPPPPKGSMDEMMNLYMPEQMRAIGLAMHTAAGKFAALSHNAAKTGDGSAVYGALSQVTQYCVACHAVYRVQ